MSGEEMAVSDVSRALTRVGAAVVGLQEAPAADGELTAAVRAALSDAGYVHIRVFETSQSHLDPDVNLAVVVASKLPLSDVEFHFLPLIAADISSSSAGEQIHPKGVLSCRIDLDGCDIWLFVVHLVPYHRFGILPDDPRVEQQLEALVEFVETKASDPSKVLVIGDFNLVDRSLLEGRLCLSGAFRDVATRPNGKCHDDIMFGRQISLDGSPVSLRTWSDHDLIVGSLVVASSPHDIGVIA